MTTPPLMKNNVKEEDAWYFVDRKTRCLESDIF
jgi:hypothetical protein